MVGGFLVPDPEPDSPWESLEWNATERGALWTLRGSIRL